MPEGGGEAALLQDTGAGLVGLTRPSGGWPEFQIDSTEPLEEPRPRPSWGQATRKWIWHKLQRDTQTREASSGAFSRHLEKFYM